MFRCERVFSYFLIKMPETLTSSWCVQVMSQSFSAWKKILDDLVFRRSAVPSLNLDQHKISHIQRIKALCTLQTKEVNKSPYITTNLVSFCVYCILTLQLFLFRNGLINQNILFSESLLQSWSRYTLSMFTAREHG